MTTPMDHFHHYKPPSTKIPFKKEKKYHVFLSFRGLDVRSTLVDHLYHSLTAAGIHTFLDSEKLEKGQDIGVSLKDAIHHSDILIPIFSTRYADSSWCLQELCLMCSSENKIIPLFYDVKPSDVRYPHKGVYAVALHKHQDRHSPHTVNQWKDALKQISSLSGWSLEAASGYQGKLVKEIVMDLLKTLDIIWLDVAKHPVGLEQRKNDLIKLLKVDPYPDDSVLTVGIYGMGGLGKTTLSKALFNDIHSRFEASSFVSDVRESAQQSNGLTNLQRQILKDLTGEKITPNSVAHGTSQMRSHLGSKRALVILDDVDDHKQVDALGRSDWFGEGSRIIVTTRNKHVLNVGQADEEYAMEGLEFEQAIELFSWHAFLRVCPDMDFSDLSQRIVNACKGLPLSLEIIGAHLFDMKDDRECWYEALRRIERMQDEDLYKTLKISYDGLNYEEQQIFLDIACFFLIHNHSVFDDPTTMYEMKSVSKLWKASGWNANTAVKNLSLKSLIRVDEDDCFVMHDHLRDLGRRIVREESLEEPGKRSRLWYPHDVCQGAARVRSLLYHHPNFTSSGVKLSTESLAVMTNLQFLSLEGICIEGNMGELPPTLKWLKFDSCELKFLASEWNMEHLVFLQLTNSRIVDVGKLNWHSESTDEFKFDQDESTHSFEEWSQSTDEFDEDESAHSLEEWSQSRDKMDQDESAYSFEDLSTDEFDQDESADYLEEWSLLEEIGNLKSLEILHLQFNEFYTLPESFSKLSNLIHLDLSHCHNLLKLPTLPKTLVQLELEGCCQLLRIPTMSHMKRLKVLNLSGCTLLAELPELESLYSLTELYLGGCEELVEVPPLPEGLVDVNLHDCSQLLRIPTMSHMKKLKVLNLSGCTWLAELPDLESLESLIELYLGGCKKLVEVPTLPAGLVNVYLHDCLQLLRIPAMSHMKKLKVLNLSSCSRLAELPELESLESLTELYLGGCKELAEMPTLPEGLVHVNLEYCYQLLRIPTISHMKNLKILNLSGCTKLAELPELESLESLKELWLNGCDKLVELPTLPKGLTHTLHLVQSCKESL
eukprot:Gb_14946 [translate_table: standard]